MKGQVVSGRFGEIVARVKSDVDLELGELLTADSKAGKVLLQVYDLVYSSQISQQNLELISGMNLEESSDFEFMDAKLRNYELALLKSLVTIKPKKVVSSKSLPTFFSEIKEITKEDVTFLTKPKEPLFLGNLRSGTRDLNFPVFLPAEKVFSHHVLITGTTGKGKSVLMTNLIWDTIEKESCALLVLDPHDEYFGRNKKGLKDHPSKKVCYYTSKNPPTGQKTLKINLKCVKPHHLSFIDFSQPQRQAMGLYYKKYGDKWVEAVILEKPLNVDFNEATISVLKRRLLSLLDLDFNDTQVFCEGIFSLNAGETIISDICSELESSKTVIVDTSNFSGQTELLIGSLVASEILRRYKNYKIKGEIDKKPVISVVLEEAPRVIGKEILEKGSNVFSTIAREGRKFKVGLVAITQLPSLIPRVILANMNTKIILGTEMNSERQAIIESASQDLSSDNRSIASLDVGEAIVSSNFSKFALPIHIPLFEDMIQKQKKEEKEDSSIKTVFSGVKL
ncbi:MAG: ATP-binding protein [Nanoarchaeota archaeon]|nr:ATP-binding protein [Nanoarchaeota archaeon]MBU1030386.1 ATP-binding protein [Nanoarchaeota archaeon]MBU1850273.1 ATP-binding protein [Nanoarchaeota archaeon]